MLTCLRSPGIVGLGVFMMAVAARLAPAGDRDARVPPWQEIEILDPNADPLGRPAVEIAKDPGGDCMQVNIPPAVIVHRYYYTGDRSFQGPMLPGGPSVVVMNHPKTGQRCYIPVQMLPGAPVVRYTAHGIEYDYGHNGITVSFGLLGAPKVTYRNHVPLSRQVHSAAAGAVQVAACVVEKTGLPHLTYEAAKGTKNLVGHVAEGCCEVGKRVAAPAVAVARSTPLGSVFSGGPEDQAQRHRDCQVRRAAHEEAESSADIPTLR